MRIGAARMAKKQSNKLSFDKRIASVLGIAEAIIFDDFIFWRDENRKAERHFHDGVYWSGYFTYRDLARRYGVFSEKSAQRAIKKLETHALITSGCFNQKKFDKTRWYRPLCTADEAAERLDAIAGFSQDERFDKDNLANTTGQDVHIDVDKMANAPGQNDHMEADSLTKPIPTPFLLGTPSQSSPAESSSLSPPGGSQQQQSAPSQSTSCQIDQTGEGASTCSRQAAVIAEIILEEAHRIIDPCDIDGAIKKYGIAPTVLAYASLSAFQNGSDNVIKFWNEQCKNKNFDFIRGMGDLTNFIDADEKQKVFRLRAKIHGEGGMGGVT